jgi:GntR family transcriptional regulator, arabinose operon transcriptional repressor
MTRAPPKKLKHLRVYAALHQSIVAGRWDVGAQLPSEAELVKQFGVSRITVGRAVKDLQAAGLVERRAGAGTFVKSVQRSAALSFGLLIPDLGETEIFGPICQGIMASPLAREHALLWGNTGGLNPSKEALAWQLCQQYIERRVSGVFLAPLESGPSKEEVNGRIVKALEEARIAVVLLDRSLLAYPQLGRHDLVGIDNRAAGYFITKHLLSLGCRRIGFVGMKNGASTIDAREAGYREALYISDAPVERSLIYRGDADDIEAIGQLMKAQRPDGIVCANDQTAGKLMHSLRRQGYRVPEDVRLVGIDDVEYASLLPVPLTTLRQPTRQIGDAALAAMLQRIARPDLPARETRLSCEFIVRDSCGARMAQAA